MDENNDARNAMQFKEGLGWKACYDEEQNIYTAQRSWRGFYQLCEIDAETYHKLGDDAEADKLIGSGRVLFESDDDYYTQRYYRIVDENYDELAPWASAKWIAGKSDALDKREAVVSRFPGVAFPLRPAERQSHRLRDRQPDQTLRR